MIKLAVAAVMLLPIAAAAENCETITHTPVITKKAIYKPSATRKPAHKPVRKAVHKPVRKRQVSKIATVIKSVSTYDCTTPSAPGRLSFLPPRVYFGGQPEVYPFGIPLYGFGGLPGFPAYPAPSDDAPPTVGLPATPPTEVPEPASLALLGMGFIGMLGMRRRGRLVSRLIRLRGQDD